MRRIQWLALAVCTWGCGGEPPFDALALRDALLADPRVLEALSEQERKTLQERFEEAEAQTESAQVDASGQVPLEVAALDAVRQDRGDDALVAAKLTTEEGKVRFAALPLASGEGRGLKGQDVSWLPASEAEHRALESEAGKKLSRWMDGSGATRLVRVSNWPVAVVAAGDTLYVNGSYLTAWAGPPPEVGQHQAAINRFDSPYSLHASMEDCIAAVKPHCESCRTAGVCKTATTLKEFSSIDAECSWLLEQGDDVRVAAICAAGFADNEAVALCLQSANCLQGRPTNTQNSIAAIASYMKFSQCREAVNTCIRGGRPPRFSPSGNTTVFPSAGSGGSSASCGSCSSSCSGCSTGSCSGGGCSGGSCSGSSGSGCGGGSSGGGCGGGGGGSGCSGGGGGSGCSGGGGSSGCSGGGGSSGCSGGGGGGSCSGGGGGGGCTVVPGVPAEGLIAWLSVLTPLAYLGWQRRRS